MRPYLIGLSLGLSLIAALPAAAQGPAAPAMITFASTADVAAALAKAKVDRKPGSNTTSEPLLSLAPYRANLEYRTGLAAAAVHETEAELMYVISGGGTVVLGGKLVGEARTNPANLTGTGIEGGTTRHVAKGDLFIVPQGTPHQITAVEPGDLVLMTLHVPRTGG